MTKDNRIDKTLKRIAASNTGSKVKLRAKATKTQGHSIYLDYYLSKKRTYEFLGLYLTGDQAHDTISIGQAYEIRKIRETEIVYRTAGAQAGEWKRRSDFKEYITHKGKNKSRSWASVNAALNKFHPAPIRFTDLSYSFIEGFRDYLLANYSQNTAWAYFNTFKAALNCAVKDQILLSNPTQGITIRKMDTEKIFLSSEELHLLQRTPYEHPETARSFLFACFTGLRISDIIRLDWESIDYQTNSISLRMKKTDNMLYIPLLAEAKKLLGDPLPSGRVFDLPAESTIRKRLTEWIKQAGIQKDVTFHSARHTFAILAIDAGIGIHIIQKLLGHSAIELTMIYAKVRDKNLNEAASKLQQHFDDNKD
ncbi:MAG: site-specific integrase [Candidatus Cloacimonetes bacterium]|jgi:integrase|nr:site-specific integrase [Candidatus Cloacimonadota bacterium]